MNRRRAVPVLATLAAAVLVALAILATLLPGRLADVMQMFVR